MFTEKNVSLLLFLNTAEASTKLGFDKFLKRRCVQNPENIYDGACCRNSLP